jgi:peroxiredoxin
MPALPVGAMAPDFKLPGVIGEQPQQFRLRDYRGNKHVVLAFHPLDWTPT